MNDFSKSLHDFFTKYLIAQRGISENTIKNYRDTFIQLLLFLKEYKGVSAEKVEISTLDRNTINDFLNYLEEEKHVCISTRNNRLAGIKSFYRYVSYHFPIYIGQCSTIFEIQAKKSASKPMEYLSIQAIQILLQTLNQNNRKDLRKLCVIGLLYESGSRVSELIQIKTYEIRLTAPCTLTLHGKGNKTRIIPIDQTICEFIEKYIKAYNIEKEGFLFVNNQNEKLTREGVAYILKKSIEKAKEKDPLLFPSIVSPHSLRHSKAMHLLENGVNLIYIRDILGHSSVTTTEIYSKANPEIKRKHIEQASSHIIDSLETDYNVEDENELLSWLKMNL